MYNEMGNIDHLLTYLFIYRPTHPPHTSYLLQLRPTSYLPSYNLPTTYFIIL
jgi:hypothetical protein